MKRKLLFITIISIVAFLLSSCLEHAESIETPESAEETPAVSEYSPIPVITSSLNEENQAETDLADGFLLRMKKKNEDIYQTDGCIIDAFSIIYEETDFPDKDAVSLAKEMVYSNLEWKILIDLYKEYGDVKSGTSTPKLEFICGAYQDFDNNGKNESVVLLGASDSPTAMISSYFLFYINGNEAFTLSESLALERFELLRFGDSVCVGMARTWSTGLGSWEDVYSFFDEKPDSILCGRFYTYDRGYFSCYDYYKFIQDWDTIAIWDDDFKTLRELGIEEISREEFVDFFENGTEGLEYFEAVTGQSKYKIYTQGYVYFFLRVSEDATYIFMTDENGDAQIKDSPQRFASQYLESKDDYLYGINANNLKPVYQIDLPEKTIDRINELAQKSKTFAIGLTEDEQSEFESLKKEYFSAID